MGSAQKRSSRSSRELPHEGFEFRPLCEEIQNRCRRIAPPDAIATEPALTSEGVRSEGEVLNPDHVINIELLQNQDHSILLSQVSEKWKWIVWINPMSVPLEALRITCWDVARWGSRKW